MSIQSLQDLRELATKFKSNDKLLVKTLLRKGFDDSSVDKIWDELVDIVSRVRKILGEEPVLQINDPGVKRTLVSIRESDEKFIFFRMCNILEMDSGTFPPNYKELEDYLLSEINGQVHPTDLIRRRMEIGTIFVGQSVPDSIRGHLTKIRDCYCFGFPDAASIWCRSLIVVGIKEALKRRGKVKSNKTVQYPDERKLNELINMCRGIFEARTLERMKNVQRTVNHLLHSDISTKEGINFLPVIKDTFKIIERIFE
jgi:hypothetical protein